MGKNILGKKLKLMVTTKIQTQPWRRHDVVWIFSMVPWICEFQAATLLATQSIMGKIFLRGNSMDLITFATRSQPVEVELPSQQPPSQFYISLATA